MVTRSAPSPKKSNKLAAAAKTYTSIETKLARGYLAKAKCEGGLKMGERAQIVLYSKPGCHLCEEMKVEISKANCAGLYELQEINIESDAELLARYRNDIPVLSINGVDAFKHRLSCAKLQDYLDQLACGLDERTS